jgi:hypothetical protein
VALSLVGEVVWGVEVVIAQCPPLINFHPVSSRVWGWAVRPCPGEVQESPSERERNQYLLLSREKTILAT